MEIFASVLIICLSVIYLFERLLPVLRESQFQMLEEETPSAPPPQLLPEMQEETLMIEPMPSDLVMIAEEESENWARESALKAMLDVYVETRDWNIVRRMWRPGGGPVS